MSEFGQIRGVDYRYLRLPMKTRVARILFLLLIVCPHFLCAQFLRYRNYDVEDGLPSSEVYDMLQDKRGFMWFTTDMGVSRYDGYSFTNYSTEQGLPDNTVFNAYEDRKGRIWFSSFSGKLCYFENERFHVLSCNQKLSELVKGQFITSLYLDAHDTIWLGTTDTISIRIAPGWSEENISSRVYTPSHGYMCIIDSVGLITGGNYFAHGGFDVYQKNKLQYSITAIENFSGLQGVRYGVTHCGDGSFILSANSELIRFDENGVKYRTTIDAIGICMLPESDGTILIGTYEGVKRYTMDSLQLQSSVQKLEHKIATAIVRDRENGLWYCTEGSGVYNVAYNSFLYYTTDDGLTDSKITCATVMNGMLFLGHINGNISKMKGSEVSVAVPEQSGELPGSQNRIATLLSGMNNELLACTGAGIYRIDVENMTSSKITSPGAKKLLLTRNGSLWAFRFRKLVKFDQETFEELSSNVFPVYADNLYEDSEGRIWVCAINGMWTYDSLAGFEHEGARDSLLSLRIVDVGETDNHTMWFASRGSGVIVQTRDTTFQITRTDGLAGNMCRTLLVDTGNTIWVGTNNGLSKIHFAEDSGLTYTIETYSTDAGLLSNEITDLFRMDDKLIIVHASCVSVCNPLDLARPSFSPPVYITSANQSADTSFSDGAQFGHTQNYFTFAYVGISYRDPGEIYYRYKLEGADGEWRTTTNTFAAYQSLPPGDYRFIVEANTGGDVWNSSAAVRFSILPAWWQTWIFKLCVLALIGVLLFLIFRWRINISNRKHLRKIALQNRLATFELNALRAQMNPHFVFNAINSVQYFITENDPDSSQKYLSKFAKLIRYVVDNSRLSYISVKAEIEALTLYLELEALRFGDRMKYSFEIDDDVDIEYIQIPSMLIQPYVENSIWHGIMHKEGEGKISIRFSVRDEMLYCTIEDNGVGRGKSMEIKRNRPKANHKSIGMTNTRERLEIINQVSKNDLKVVVTDLYSPENVPCGTRVELSVPIDHH